MAAETQYSVDVNLPSGSVASGADPKHLRAQQFT